MALNNSRRLSSNWKGVNVDEYRKQTEECFANINGDWSTNNMEEYIRSTIVNTAKRTIGLRKIGQNGKIWGNREIKHLTIERDEERTLYDKHTQR